MNAYLSCGLCEAQFQIESDQEDPSWMMVFRFADAHAVCGYMTPSQGGSSDADFQTGMIKPRLADESGET